MIKSILLEPLVHFAAAALLIFFYFSLTGADLSADRTVIRVSKAQLSAKWQQIWRRPPTETEFEGLIKQTIRDELLVQRALELGLDQGDAVVRNRMIQKMQFLRDQQIEAPAEAELQAWFEQQRQRYLIGPRVTFKHAFLGQSVPQGTAKEYAQQKQAGKPTNLTPSPLISIASQYQRVELDNIASQFGSDFATQLQQLEIGKWQAPVQSGYGVHAVKINEVIPERQARFSDPEIRQRVENDYLAVLRDNAEKQWLAELQKQALIEVID